ncbi:vWA domain-containing protein [Metabacillus sp. FJAT-52054]|uniref:VWA domain-containing protein n=1 Tax=Metabacillus sediminis TaxID=3117746 RepID=A0ABZ2NHY3_9BACI
MKAGLKEIVFLLDRSGSMAGLEQETIEGFNSLIKKQTEREGETNVTAVLFDDQYEVLWNGADAKEVSLSKENYDVRGCTALLDAIGKAILEVGSRLQHTEENQRPDKVMFVITTDGMENASREFTHDKVKDLITHQREKYNWEFLFLGANIDAFHEANLLGVQQDMVHEFTASAAGIEAMYSSVQESINKIVE